MKQYHILYKIFDDCMLDDNGQPILNGENWHFVDDIEIINQISASITGGGTVWLENGVLKASGAAPSSAHFWHDGRWKLDKAIQKSEFQEAKLLKTQELNEIAQNFINQMTGADKLPEFEIKSWDKQAAEARAWATDNTLVTPILDQIALERGISANELKQKVLEKAQKSDMIVAAVVGQRQALQTQIEHTKNIDELSAIEIAFHLPELK